MKKDKDHEIVVGFPADRRKITVTTDDADLRPWDLDTRHRVVGTDVDRVDGAAKASGRAKYSYDINLPGMLYGAILRSPHPRGTLRAVDLAEVIGMPGVVAVTRIKRDGQRLRFVGDEIAAVAARTLDQARDALERARVDIAVEPHETDFLEVEGAPAIEDGAVTDPWPADERIDGARSKAAFVHEATYRTEVQTHSSLETHGVVARWNGDDLEVWASTQATFGVRSGLKGSLTERGVPPSSVTVHTEFMGGGFGSKFPPGNEAVAACLLAREADAPVKLMLDRYEEHTCVGHRPGAVMQIRAGTDQDGTIVSWEYRSWGDPGHGGSGRTTYPGHYTRGAAVGRTRKDLRTDNNAARAMRAPGWPQGFFAGERMMDELAAGLGMDPLAFRMANDPQTIRREQWQLGADRFGWKKAHNPEPGTPRNGDGRHLRGAGLASAAWGQVGSHGGRTPHGCTCRLHQDGTVEVRSGAQDIGTGMKTVMAMVAAEELQIPVERVRVTMGHTGDPSGPASGGSTTTPSLAPAVRHAAGLARQALEELVAEKLGDDRADVVTRRGTIGVPDGEQVPFDRACKWIGPNPLEVQGRRFPNYGGRDFQGYQRGVCGCQFAEVEVDTWTGVVRVQRMLAVQDCGLVIARKLAESQVLGAMIQGMSYALHEQRIMDHASGRMLNGDLAAYKISGTGDMPEMEAVMFSVANGGNNVGAAGLGEPPVIAAPAAIANAVANAVGVPVRSLPITPDKVLAALDQRG